jgi:hypothetical protein
VWYNNLVVVKRLKKSKWTEKFGKNTLKKSLDNHKKKEYNIRVKNK